MNDIHIPVGITGPGTQPSEEDGAELNLLQMPDEMTTYSMPVIPEAEEISNLVEARNLLQELYREISRYNIEDPATVLDLSHLDAANRDLVDQVLGEGEVSILFDSKSHIHIQESVLTGIWRVQYFDETEKLQKDTIEIAAIPDVVRQVTFAESRDRVKMPEGQLPEGVINAPALVTELDNKVSHYQQGQEAHVVNLTLLPQTEEDLAFLDKLLGKGSVAILSRGYGNCRITSTATRNVWWVQYFNSQDAMILNTLEVTDVPSVSCASREDIEDSSERLHEILEACL